MPGGQARMSGAPPRRRSKRWSHSCLTACPAPRPPATRRGWVVDAPSARAASLASSAALPRPLGRRPHPAPLGGGNPYVNGYVNPYVIPYALGVRTPGVGARGCLCSSDALRGASRPQKPRPTGPPRGSGAAAPGGALRAIDPSARPRLRAGLRPAPPAAAISACPGCHAPWCGMTRRQARPAPVGEPEVGGTSGWRWSGSQRRCWAMVALAARDAWCGACSHSHALVGCIVCSTTLSSSADSVSRSTSSRRRALNAAIVRAAS
jgi:hypothetical protein